AVFEADAVEGFEGFLFVGHAVEVLGEHDVLDGGEIRDHVELLEDEADGFGADGAVEASDEIDHGSLARTGGAHHRDPLAGRDGERDVVERFNEVEAAIIFFRSGGITLGDVLELDHPNLSPSTLPSE